MKKHWHLIGIGGIGMSGLARILLSRGDKVTGSDLAQSNVIDSLRSMGAEIFSSHTEENVLPEAHIVYSTDILDDNPEMRAARKLGCKTLHRSELLLELTKGFQTLAVTGTHGKTTTSSLLAWTLLRCGMEPSFAVGGILPQLSSNAGYGEGKYFALEADESDGTFLTYNAYGAIVTNIGLDHMNTYESEQGLLDSFQQFTSRVFSKRHLFWCGDDARLRLLSPEGQSYGFGEDNQWRITQFMQRGWEIQFDLLHEDRTYSEISLPLTGRHNACNAAAVFGLMREIGASEEEIRTAFSEFRGVLRRCEKKGEREGVLFLDDYAHHPTELKATLGAIRDALPGRRLIALYQPHRYSRTRDCLGSFAGVFDSADQLILTDIYAAREQPIPGISPQAILQELQDAPFASFYLAKEGLSDYLKESLQPGDVLVTLGAGDITRIGPEVLDKLSQKEGVGGRSK